VQITRRQQSLDKDSEISEEWRTLAFVVDRLIFWISLIILVVVAFWMIAKSAEHPQLERQSAVHWNPAKAAHFYAGE